MKKHLDQDKSIAKKALVQAIKRDGRFVERRFEILKYVNIERKEGKPEYDYTPDISLTLGKQLKSVGISPLIADIMIERDPSSRFFGAIDFSLSKFQNRLYVFDTLTGEIIPKRCSNIDSMENFHDASFCTPSKIGLYRYAGQRLHGEDDVTKGEEICLDLNEKRLNGALLYVSG
jgi:hypothetical protein